MQPGNLGRPTSRVVVFLDLRGMGNEHDGDFESELAALAFELWEAAGVLMRLVGTAESVEEQLVEDLAVDLIRWDLDGPDWLGYDR